MKDHSVVSIDAERRAIDRWEDEGGRTLTPQELRELRETRSEGRRERPKAAANGRREPEESHDRRA